MPQQSQIRKVLYNEVAFVIAIIGVAFGVINWIYSPSKTNEQNIALIQQSIKIIEGNHLTHLQGYAEEIKSLKEHDTKNDDRIVEMEKKLDLIIYKLDEHSER